PPDVSRIPSCSSPPSGPYGNRHHHPRPPPLCKSPDCNRLTHTPATTTDDTAGHASSGTRESAARSSAESAKWPSTYTAPTTGPPPSAPASLTDPPAPRAATPPAPARASPDQTLHSCWPRSTH